MKSASAALLEMTYLVKAPTKWLTSTTGTRTTIIIIIVLVHIADLNKSESQQ